MSSPLRVLVVEDDATLRDVLFEVLSARGLKVVASSRGEEALQLARQEPFDLIVADIRMEGIDGLDTIEQARQLQPDIGSIVVSGFASEEETLRAVRLNVAGYLKKPFKVPELMDVINRFLAQRETRLRREAELRDLREALLWSLEQQGAWGEKAHPGLVQRPARLAGALASEPSAGQLRDSGQSYGRVGSAHPDLARQAYLGTLLHRLDALGGADLPSEAIAALQPFSQLLRLWRDGETSALCRFAIELCASLSPDQSWPAPESLTFPEKDLESAYRAFLRKEAGDSGQDEATPPPSGPAGLLGLARALEHGGDFAGAGAAYRDLLREGETSPVALAAMLGSARIAVAQGSTPALEKSMADLLSMAEKMGPVTFALAELEGARVLQRAGHPATRKLFERAVQNLGKVNLTVPWAGATIVLAGLADSREPAEVDKALERLCLPHHFHEVVEQLDFLLPALLELPATAGNPRLEDLKVRLVRDFPQEAVSQLRRGQLKLRARQSLLSLLEFQGLSVPGALLDLLQNDPDPDVRARSLALRARLGLTESLPVVRVYSLGPLEVILGDQTLSDRVWKTQKAKYLFARLAYSAPRPMSVDRILEDLWPDSEEEGARNSLNTAVSTIRRVLKGTNEHFDPVLRVNETLALNPQLPLWHDVKELELAHSHAQRSLEAGNLEEAMPQLSRVALLYRGPYLEGCYLDWSVERQIALENTTIDALSRLAEHRVEQYRHREALEYALRLLLLQPDHERAHEIVMSAHIGLEQHDKAAAHFEAQRTRLSREQLGDPSMEMTKLYQMARYGFVREPGFNPRS